MVVLLLATPMAEDEAKDVVIHPSPAYAIHAVTWAGTPTITIKTAKFRKQCEKIRPRRKPRKTVVRGHPQNLLRSLSRGVRTPWEQVLKNAGSRKKLWLWCPPVLSVRLLVAPAMGSPRLDLTLVLKSLKIVLLGCAIFVVILAVVVQQIFSADNLPLVAQLFKAMLVKV